MTQAPGASAASPFCRASVVIPCYNEAQRLNVAAFHQFLQGPDSVRIIFVDDGSKDATLSVLETLCHGFPGQTAIVRCQQNVGKAEAVRRGMLHAIQHFDSETVGFWDADLATPLDAIPRFLHLLDTHPEIAMVFGSRVKLLGRHVQRHPRRHYLGRIFATVVSLLLRLPIYDTQCGAKLFRISSGIGEVLAEPFLSKWIFDVEIIARYLQRYGNDPTQVERMIYEYPLERWEDVAGSKLRSGDFLTAFADVLKIRRKYLR
jgi:glycosyltransferase involved in cell wall biosynthesis